MSLVTAYYKGLVDILTVITSDTIISIPAFLLVMMISVVFQDGNHPLAEPLNGGVLLGLIFAFVYWPGMWRTIRGPSLQVAEEEWVDAARSYGQTPANTMRKHMAPYIAGYMIYLRLAAARRDHHLDGCAVVPRAGYQLADARVGTARQ